MSDSMEMERVRERLTAVEVTVKHVDDRLDRHEQHMGQLVEGIFHKLDDVIANQNRADGAKQATTVLGHLGSGLVGAMAGIASIFTWFSGKH